MPDARSCETLSAREWVNVSQNTDCCFSALSVHYIYLYPISTRTQPNILYCSPYSSTVWADHRLRFPITAGGAMMQKSPNVAKSLLKKYHGKIFRWCDSWGIIWLWQCDISSVFLLYQSDKVSFYITWLLSPRSGVAVSHIETETSRRFADDILKCNY